MKKKFDALMNEKQEFLDKSLSAKMIKCSFCNFHGHTIHTYLVRKKVPFRIRQVWVPKVTRDLVSNLKDPKQFGYQKSNKIVSCRCARARSYNVRLKIEYFRHTMEMGNL